MVAMNNIEQNALRIADLLGYKKVLDMYCKNGQSFHEHKIETFSSYNGLMDIVLECNYVQDDLDIVKSDVSKIKHDLKRKVDYEDFEKLEKRFLKVERLVFSKLT